MLNFGQDGDETTPSPDEAINLARNFQALPADADTHSLAPSIPQADYEDDVSDDNPLADSGGKDVLARRRSTRESMWHGIRARRRSSIKDKHTLSRTFMKNYRKLGMSMKKERLSETTPDELESEARNEFKNLKKGNLTTIVKMALHPGSKDHIIKRSDEVKSRWQRGVRKIARGAARFPNVVEEVMDIQRQSRNGRDTNADRRMSVTSIINQAGCAHKDTQAEDGIISFELSEVTGNKK